MLWSRLSLVVQVLQGKVMSDILDFIQQFKEYKSVEDAFRYGHCYYFALILQQRFGGEIFYDPINGHFLFGVDGEYYDITGKAIPAYGTVKWAEMETIDPVWYQRVKKHCVNK